MTKVKQLKKITWEPIFSREGFSYFIASLAFAGYVLDMEKKIGWGYRDQLLVSKNNFLTVYGSTRDQESFIKFFAKKDKVFFIKINNLIIAELNKAERGVNQVNRLLIKKNLSSGEMKNILTIFYKNYRNLYSVYRFSTLFDNYYNGKTRKELIEKFSKTKDKCGRFFTKTDKTVLIIIRNRLSRLIEVKPKLLLNLNYQEIINSIHEKKLVISKSELRLRRNSFILLAVDREIKLFMKDQAELLKNNFVFAVQKVNINQIKGQAVYPGEIKGRVKVVFLASQLKSAGEGLILVTPMTTVNHAPFLKNYSAIVTDEGGITSHAAIISREFKIPCVIGTKIATKVFKDGDYVEVDANKGVVKIIRKK